MIQGMKISVDSVKRFKQFELSSALDHVKYRGDDLWPAIRYAVFYYLISDHYVYKNHKKKIRLRNYVGRLLISLKGLLWCFRRADVLLLDTGRNSKIGSFLCNPTSLTFDGSISGEYRVTIIDTHGTVNAHCYGESRIIDVSLIIRIARFISRWTKNSCWNEYVSSVENEINYFFDSKINLESLYTNVFIHQTVLVRLLKIIARFTKPKVLVYSDNGSLSLLIKKFKLQRK